MSDTKTTFDNIGVVNDAKRFEQSQDKVPSHLELPDVYQEFDEIEHEIDRETHTVNEVTMFADRLDDAKVVRKDDVLALESLVGTLENLPHVNSYTQDYSMVNYQITQENVAVTVTKFLAGLLKKMAEYIARAFAFVKKHLTRVLYKNAYTDSSSKQEDVKDNVRKAKAQAEDVATQAASGYQDASASTPDNAVMPSMQDAAAQAKRADRIVGMNKQLRRLLYPKFKELQVLSAGGEINPSLLIDEICAQRMTPFYTTFFKALYEKDAVLKNTIEFLARRVSSDFIVLVDRTQVFYSQDISVSPDSPYQTMYSVVPEQINDYLDHFNAGSRTNRKGGADYKDTMTQVKDLTKSICSIATTHPLPEPRAILEFDLNWIGDLFDDNVTNIGRDIETQFKDIAKAQKVILKNSNNVHPDAQRDMMALYSDWMVLNRMANTLALLRNRANAMYENIDRLSTIIIEVTDILSYK